MTIANLNSFTDIHLVRFADRTSLGSNERPSAQATTGHKDSRRTLGWQRIVFLSVLSLLVFAFIQLAVPYVVSAGCHACIMSSQGPRCFQFTLPTSRRTTELQNPDTAETSLSKRLVLPLPLPDFALEANGGRIYSSLTTPREPNLLHFGPDAATVIRDSPEIGRQWWFPSSNGQVGLRLAKPIHPSSVTIDYVSSRLSTNAPRKMTLWGVIDGPANEARYNDVFARHFHHTSRISPPLSLGRHFVPVAEFEYNIHDDTHSQTFPAAQYIWEYKLDFGVMVIEIESNWGGAETCLHRVRVHGEQVIT